MFLSVFSSAAHVEAKAQSPCAVMKIKFARALAWIDFGLCLVIFTLVPRRYPYEWSNWLGKIIAPYRWDILLPLFLAVVMISIGAYRIVDAFYKWPSNDQ